MTVIFKKTLPLFIVFIILFFTSCVKEKNQVAYMPLNTPSPHLTQIKPIEIILSDEFAITENIHSLYFINDLLYFLSDQNPVIWHEFDFVTKQVIPAKTKTFTYNQLIQEIVQNTDRKPSLSDFFPSPSRQKVLFAELQNTNFCSQKPICTYPIPTTSPTNNQESIDGEILTLTEPLEYFLYIYDVKKKKTVRLGSFMGDIGQILWSNDENMIAISRNSISVYDYLSPMGIWLVDINKQLIENITPDDSKKKEMIPKLLSNDGRLFLFFQLSKVDPSIEYLLIYPQTKEITVLPISSINRFWWLEQGKLFAYISVDNYTGKTSIRAFDLNNNIEIQVLNGAFSADLFSSNFQVSTSGKFITFSRGNTLYGREILVK